jgi:hypothetical protein
LDLEEETVRKHCLSICLAAILGSAAMASADSILFSDNFNSENGGVPVLNYYGFANWTVTSGSVDLIGNGYFDFLPGNGLYVDLDGSTNQAGTMVSKPMALDAGSYLFQFDLAGSQRGPIEPVTASVNNDIASQVYALPSSQPFTTFDIPFTLATPQSITLSFAEVGNSDEGLLLDNVDLIEKTGSAVPLPSTAACGLTMLGTLMALRIRKNRLA